MSNSCRACWEREGCLEARGDTGMPRMFSAKLERWLLECELADMLSGAGGDRGEGDGWALGMTFKGAVLLPGEIGLPSWSTMLVDGLVCVCRWFLLLVSCASGRGERMVVGRVGSRAGSTVGGGSSVSVPMPCNR